MRTAFAVICACCVVLAACSVPQGKKDAPYTICEMGVKCYSVLEWHVDGAFIILDVYYIDREGEWVVVTAEPVAIAERRVSMWARK